MPRFQKCFSTLGCPSLTLDEVIALATSRDIDAIELRALNGSIDLTREFERAFGTPQALRAWIGEKPVTVPAIGTSFHLHGHTPQDRDALTSFIPWAEALGTPWLRVFDGCKKGDAKEIAQAVEGLEWWKDLRRREGWTVDVVTETHDATAIPDALRRFLSAAPDCRILWDAHHTWRRGGEPPAETWAYLKGHVEHVHFKDSVSTPGKGEGYRYVVPGAGEFPLAELVRALDVDGYAGALCLEWERMWHPDLGPLEEALDGLDAEPWWRSQG